MVPSPSHDDPRVAALPRGLVVFVFTDIEGSTRLLHHDAEAYGDSVERHRELIRSAADAFHGHVMAAEGDSSFMVFGDADQAVAAAAALQRAIAEEPWPEHGRLAVRIGAHCGLAAPRGYDYVTLAVHQAARVTAAGHGGQVVLSEEVVALLSADARAHATALGRFRVRDFEQPVELFEYRSAGTPTSFPPLRVASADQHNLPGRLGPFVNRVDELAALQAACVPSSVVTLVGPGGVGKTRLSVEHGGRSLHRWPDGAWFIDLAGVADDSAVLPEFLDVLDLPDGGEQPARAIRDALTERQLLLIVDNAEHVRDTLRDLIRTVMPGTGQRSCVLVTSREPLGVADEVLVRVDPLVVGDERHQGPAVEMFHEHAKRLAPHRPLGADDAAAVVQLCERLDGLPLAIEMAAARIAAFRPAEILAGIADTAASLTLRDAPAGARHQTFHQLLDWSESRLTPDERVAFSSLGVLPGSFGYDTAAAAVHGALEPRQLHPALWTLVEKSLLVTQSQAGATRYRMLNTVRDAVIDRLPAATRDTVALRLGEWFDRQVGPDVMPDAAWLSAITEELDNVRGVCSLLATAAPHVAHRLAWSIGSHLDATQRGPLALDDYLEFTRQFRVPNAELVGLTARRADLLLRAARTSEAAALLDDAQQLQSAVGRCSWDDVAVERSMGELLLRTGRALEAAALAEQIIADGASPRGTARMYSLLGLVRAEQGRWADAHHAFVSEVDLWEAAGNDAALANAHGNVAEVLMRAGRHAEAAAAQLRCLQLAARLGQPVTVAYAAVTAAHLAAASGQWGDVTALLSASAAVLRDSGEQLYESDQHAIDELLRSAAAYLGDAQFARLCDEPMGISEMMSCAEATLVAASTA
jgi:predicted ATPase/class 3 adenylate cyclase